MTQPSQKPGKSKQDYATPAEFITAAQNYLGIHEFAFDFAADASNHKAVRYYTPELDALSRTPEEWAKRCRIGWGWLNPPFKRIKPWAEQCLRTAEVGGHVTLLVPAGVGSNWYRDYVHRRALVLAVNGRIPFMPDHPTWLYPKDCIWCHFGPDVVPDFDVWTWGTQASDPEEGDE